MRKSSIETINQHILNSIKDGVYGLDMNGNTTFANPAACEMTGYTVEEMIGRNQHSLIHHSHADGSTYDVSSCPIYNAIRSGKTSHVSGDFFWRKDGSCFPVEYISTPIIKDNNIIGAVVTFRDITEKKYMEELMIKSEKLSVVGELSASIAHEIGNPLTSLKGFLKLFEEGIVPKKEYLSIMKEELERIQEVSNEMMALAKPSIANYEYANLKEIVYSVKNLFDTEAFKKSINIVVEIPQSKIIIYCVKNQIKQALINVIKNAIEALNGGTITISIQKVNEKFEIIISDTGPGIPQEILLRIGEPFYTTKEKGTGLGLMVTYRIIHNHNGCVAIKSKINEGTTFIITIPEKSI
jgi:two-component system sporulation sensor kinase A